MMKSPTSLIRFRNAVGVMLALSAIFAVVISTVTLTQDRALGQTNPTVSIETDNDTVAEGGTATITVTLSEAVASDGTPVSITLMVGADGDTAVAADYTVTPDPAVVEFTAGGIATDTISILFEQNDGAESVETLTVSLSPPTGYDAGDATSVTINITDDDNTAATPPDGVTINFNDADGDLITEDDDSDDQTPETPVTGRTAKSGEALVANTSAIVDVDQPLTADTTDAEDARDAPTFTYQWIRTNDGSTTTVDDDVAIDGATSSTYKLTDEDVGDTFTVQVWSSDQYGNGDGNANDDAADSIGGENNNGQTLGTPTATDAIAYDQAKPFIIVGSLDPSGDDMRIEPGVELTLDSSGMSSTMTSGAGNVIEYNAMGDPVDVMVDLNGPDCDEGEANCDEATDPDNDDAEVALGTVTFTWHRDGDPIMECDGSGNQVDPAEEMACTAATYTLTDDDVAKEITLMATYTTRSEIPEDTSTDPDTPAIPAVMASIKSGYIGRVYSPNKATGMPTISGIAQVGSTLKVSEGSIKDADGDPVAAMITYTWFHGDDMDYSKPLGTGSSYLLNASDVGNTIKVRANFNDGLLDPDMRTSGMTTEITGSPGEISRIEPGIRGITVSAGDKVMLAVDVYGLQDAKDNGLGGTFIWTVDGDPIDDDTPNDRELEYTASSSPGNYTIVASLAAVDCDSDDEDACSASFEVRVRRPSTAPDDGVAPQNPPGEIPTILTDGDGNQYEVFTPEGGGTFTGEGYTLSAGAGAIPNGEYIGVRVSDEGSASNAGMTHQRYTLGGNMYSVSAVDASNAEITSYALNSAATVCVPLPDELRSNISNLALVAINADGSLTILSASVRLGSNGTQVCGNLSGLPASVAVGSSGAPAPLRTAVPPTATPEAPDTGGTAPTSNLALWALLLGAAIVTFGTFIVIGRRREGARK